MTGKSPSGRRDGDFVPAFASRSGNGMELRNRSGPLPAVYPVVMLPGFSGQAFGIPNLSERRLGNAVVVRGHKAGGLGALDLPAKGRIIPSG